MLVVVSTVLLVAAGCGGDSNRSRFENFQAEGLWSGTTTSGTFDGVVLDTGEYWFIYGSGGVARSVVHGTGFFRRDEWRSDDGLDYVFGFDRPYESSIASFVEPEFSINGDVFLARRLERFSVGFVPEYRFPANPAAIVGRRTGSASTLLTAGDIVVDIDGSGNIAAAVAGGCQYGGRAVPNRSGRNVFDISLSTQSSCPFAYTYNGVMVATGNRLVVTATTPDGGDVFYAVAR
jgi:hypothetical protein